MRGGSLKIVVPSGHSTDFFHGIGLIADVGFAVLRAGASFSRFPSGCSSSCTCFQRQSWRGVLAVSGLIDAAIGDSYWAHGIHPT